MSAAGTPLHYAAGSGNVSSARELMRAGARVSTVDAHGLTPLHAAAYSGQFQVLLGMFVEFPEAQRMARHICAEKLKAEEAGCPNLSPNNRSRLLPLQSRHTADLYVALSARDTAGQTALHYAAIALHVRTVKVLLDGGAIETEKDAAGNTPSDAMFQGETLNNTRGRPGSMPDERQALTWLLARGPAMRAHSWEWPNKEGIISKRDRKKYPGMIVVRVYRVGACKEGGSTKNTDVMKAFSR